MGICTDNLVAIVIDWPGAMAEECRAVKSKLVELVMPGHRLLACGASW
jgi:hypothetical protein